MSQQINLFNPRFKKQKNYFSANAMAYALGVVLACSLVPAFQAKQSVAALEREAAVVKTELAAREARKATSGSDLAPRQKSASLDQLLEQAETENRALHEVSAIIDKGEFGNTRGYSSYFRAFAHSRVDGLWLTGVRIVGAGNEIGLQGRTLQASLLPGYLGGLAREPVLKGKTFGHLEMTQPKPADAPGAAAAAAASAASAPAFAVPPYVEFSLQAASLGEQKEAVRK
ncbi:MAG: MSHA biogenesis protein MshI [Pseudomonadota bacterium]